MKFLTGILMAMAVMAAGTVCSADVGQARVEGFSYRIRANETLSEISVRLYGTTRMWKKIAQWNSIEAPFVIQSGRDLQIRKSPTISQKEGDERLRAMWRKRFIKGESIIAKISPDKDEQVDEQNLETFTVNEDTRNLSEVSIVLYGTTQFWKDIASWNSLSAPYKIYPGQKLMLERVPLLTLKDGNAKLLAMWREHFAKLEKLAQLKSAVRKVASSSLRKHSQD